MKNFIKTGFRSFKREKFFALVNLIGLTLGMFCFLVTALYVKDELTHDKWHKNAENIYFSVITMDKGGGVVFNLYPSVLIVDALKEESPGVENAVNISSEASAEFKVGEEWVTTKHFFQSQSALFDVFDFDLKYGNKVTALEAPESVILSSELAETYFPGRNPVGEFLEFKNKGTKKISGVLKPIPSNSSLQFDMISPINMEEEPYKYGANNWSTGAGLNYFLLKEGYSVEKLQADLKTILSRNKVEDHISDGYSFRSFADSYMKGETMRNFDNMFGGQMKYVYIFSLIGGLMLLVACFNYINLTTARSFARSKDIGIRKVIGASRSRLVFSQMGETLFIAFAALVVAMIGLELMLPSINMLIGKKLDIDIVQSPGVLLLPIGLLLLVVAISGIYPAVTVSGFNLSAILKGSTPRSGGNLLRKSLVVLQFLICTGLLSGALIIRGQANHMMNMDLGYNAADIMSIGLDKAGLLEKYPELRAELQAIPQIEKVTGSPLPNLNSVYFFDIGEGEEKIQLSAFFGNADKDFNELFGLEILQGSDFSQLTESELATAVLVNETTVKSIGWEDPIGKELAEGLKIVGVVKDFHYQSARSTIGSAVIKYSQDEIRNLQFKFRHGDKEAVEAQVAQVFKDFGVEQPIEMKEVDSFFAESYAREEKLVNIFDVLTGFLMAIAFLGLFALSTFENQLREKEIGIRKVLGAGYLQLVGTLNRRFLVLIIIALVASVPVSYYLINQWLTSFPYRIESLVPYFIYSIGGVIVLSLTILSVHSYMNAQKNPVNVLRNE
uniref:ABC transporter permease n=2 Tax=Roseivirga sp. TaxID=1964215 RepID=UPI004048D2BA